MTRVLLVDDEPMILKSVDRLLRGQNGWETRACTGGADALAVLSTAPVDVIVTDINMPCMDGITLLRRVRERHPGVARIVLSGHAEASEAVRAGAVAHQFLAKPCTGAQLRGTIARVLGALSALERDGTRERATWLAGLPPAPRAFAAITSALGDDRASARDIAALVERDLALASKVLQLVNGAYFGQARRVASVERAVLLLGANVLRSIVLSHELFASLAGGSSGPATERLQQHSLATASIARRMAGSGVDGETAFAAALLHDVGKLVLMCEGGPAPDAAAGGPPGGGQAHAPVGAAVLSLWGLPDEIVDVAMWHHQPASSPPASLRLAALVHAADALEHECARDAPSTPLDLSLLEELNLASELDGWRELARSAA